MKRLFVFLIPFILAGCGRQAFAPMPGHPAHADTSQGASLADSDVLNLTRRDPVDVPDLSPAGKSMHHMQQGHMRHPGEGEMPMKMKMDGKHASQKTMQSDDMSSPHGEREMTRDE